MDLAQLAALERPETVAFLTAHRDLDPRTLMLRFGTRQELPLAAIAEQLHCVPRARRKLPHWVEAGCHFLREALEQASSQATAAYKAERIAPGERGMDATAGLGVDSAAIATHFTHFIACERDAARAQLLRHNFRRLGLTAEVHHGDAVRLLTSLPDQALDCLLIDPARRDDGGRHLDPRACQPDIVALAPLYRRTARRTWIKLAPALDRHLLHRLLPELSALHYLSVDGEAKECLAVIEASDPAHCEVHVACLGARPWYTQHRWDDDRVAARQDRAAAWCLIPDPALRCAGIASTLATDAGLAALGSSGALFTGEQRGDLPGRWWQRIGEVQGHPRTWKRSLRAHAIRSATVFAQDCRINPDQIRRSCGLANGGDDALLCFRDRDDHLRAVIARRSTAPASGKGACQVQGAS